MKNIEFFVGKKYELKRYPGFEHIKKDVPPASSGEGTAHKKEPEERRHTRHTARPLTSTKNRRDGRDGRDSQGSRDNRGSRDSRDSRGSRDGGGSRGRRPQPSNQTGKRYETRKVTNQSVTPTVKEQDWRKLMEEGKKDEGFGKKLKKFFKRA